MNFEERVKLFTNAVSALAEGLGLYFIQQVHQADCKCDNKGCNLLWISEIVKWNEIGKEAKYEWYRGWDDDNDS